MLNNATPSRPHPRRRSADAPATGARPAVLNLDSAGTVRADQLGAKARRRSLAA